MRAAPAMLIAIAALSGAPASEPLAFTRAIELPGIQGRIDHLAWDAAQSRLFVAALGNNTVEVLDLRTNRHLTSLTGFHEPQGIGQPLDASVVAIANGGSGDLILLDRASSRVVRSVPLGEDADNVRFDRQARRFYVGYGSGAIGAISEDGARLGDAKLPAHPESFQLETKGSGIFVNVPGARQIAVIDRRTMTVTAHWPVSAAANYPMALDEDGRRLFVACRRPAVVLVFDTAAGRQIASFETVGDADDMFYDSKRRRLYVIGGEGIVDVFQRRDADRLDRLGRVATAPGARTGLFVPDDGRLFVAVPRRGTQRAEIRVYDVRD